MLQFTLINNLLNLDIRMGVGVCKGWEDRSKVLVSTKSRWFLGGSVLVYMSCAYLMVINSN
jgi:hypothetical protein